MDHLFLKDFSFDFPPELIAHEPLKNRDASRLLIRSKDGSIHHDHVRNLAQLLPADTLLIVNDSRVIPSRIYGKTPNGGQVEIMLLEPSGGVASEDSPETCTWQAIGRPMRKFKTDTLLSFDEGLTGKILSSPLSSAEELHPILIQFPLSPTLFMKWLERSGYIPLPPYIQRDDPKPAAVSDDTARYQTVYCQDHGSVAAPTAGLHLTPDLLSAMKSRGIEIAPVTLHVGGGTFLPVRHQDHRQHKMHEERFLVSTTTINAWRRAKESGRPIVAVGTTSLRCLESLLRLSKALERKPEELADKWHRTGLFLFPKDRISTESVEAISGLMTNFHQPESTLFMLVAALIGLDETHRLYQEAVLERYRLFSYGDSSLLWL